MMLLMGVSFPSSANPVLLIWARSEAGYTLAEAARRARVSESKLSAWEHGESTPTIRQAEHLAKAYDRSLAVLSMESPPKLPPLAADYRRLPGVRPGEEPPELRRAFRRLVQRRRLALSLDAGLGETIPKLPLQAKLSENVEEVGGRFRDALAVSLDDQARWVSEFMAYRVWRSSVERLGVLVCQMQGLSLETIRGTSIVHFPVPAIGINSKELGLSKPFTLLHELVHIGLAAGEEERPALEEHRDEKSWLEVERFCESVAGAILMPLAALEADAEVVRQRATKVWTVAGTRRVAGHFKVTPTAVATRLLRVGLMSPYAYTRWTKEWVEFKKAHPDKKSWGKATPAEKAVNRNGPLFTRMVLSALSSDLISSVDASRYLELGYAHVETLRRDWCETPADFASAMGG